MIDMIAQPSITLKTPSPVIRGVGAAWHSHGRLKPQPINTKRCNLLDVPATAQVPPLTPGTTQKMSQALLESFKSFEKDQHRLGIPKDPMHWNETQVVQWLNWAIHEFTLEGVN
ncbi:transforming protein p54/c-ets-1-like, partial [Ruditapes philippinarum]|uniref:transforming protein p54/c-ets-1-like n=1 Tax=Ruditapes philippinarum TaxID=129788 RepID=UPI00295B4F53